MLLYVFDVVVALFNAITDAKTEADKLNTGHLKKSNEDELNSNLKSTVKSKLSRKDDDSSALPARITKPKSGKGTEKEGSGQQQHPAIESKKWSVLRDNPLDKKLSLKVSVFILYYLIYILLLLLLYKYMIKLFVYLVSTCICLC